MRVLEKFIKYIRTCHSLECAEVQHTSNNSVVTVEDGIKLYNKEINNKLVGHNELTTEEFKNKFKASTFTIQNLELVNIADVINSLI